MIYGANDDQDDNNVNCDDENCDNENGQMIK